MKFVEKDATIDGLFVLGGNPIWKDIWITMTINALNYSTVDEK